MWIEADMVFSAYRPLKIEKGMRFIRLDGEAPEMYELTHDVFDRDAYIMLNGHPVEPYICVPKIALAESYEMAWVDEGEHSENMHEITIEDYNVILRNDNKCLIKVEDKLYNKEHIPVPVFDEEKVIIRLIDET